MLRAPPLDGRARTLDAACSVRSAPWPLKRRIDSAERKDARKPSEPPAKSLRTAGEDARASPPREVAASPAKDKSAKPGRPLYKRPLVVSLGALAFAVLAAGAYLYWDNSRITS